MAERIDTLVILGAGGDLTGRLLLPGVASYLASPDAQTIAVVGADRTEYTPEVWRDRVTTAFAAYPSRLATSVAAHSRYVHVDATDPESLRALLDGLDGRIALYFALPPAIAERAVQALARIDLPRGIVFALEKPFGTDLPSAKALNRLLETVLPEHQIFRVDHFLGKSTVLNLIGLRFANRIFEPLFSAENVASVEIIVDESLGLENRAVYYDKAGALVDMIQSHLLLVLALVAMEPPASLDADDLRGAMAQVLRATRPWRKNGSSSRRARYGAGTIEGRHLPAYVDEHGVDPARKTETLTEITLAIDNWRWAGVPFVMRSGKALGESRQEILVTFKDVPHLPTGLSGVPGPSRLRVSLKPATLDLDLVINGTGDPFTLDRSILHADLGDPEMTAYGEVISEIIECDPTISVRGDVAEQCWRIVAPILAAWRKDRVPLETYPAGSLGPSGW